MAQWNPHANDLFLKALEIASPEERRAFLAEACAGELREQVEDLLRRGERFATMHDVRFAGRLDPVRRKRFTDWVRANDAVLRKLMIAHAAVVQSGLQQGVMTAVLWLIDPPAPMKVFTDPNEARAWLKQRVEAERARGQ